MAARTGIIAAEQALRYDTDELKRARAAQTLCQVYRASLIPLLTQAERLQLQILRAFRYRNMALLYAEGHQIASQRLTDTINELWSVVCRFIPSALQTWADYYLGVTHPSGADLWLLLAASHFEGHCMNRTQLMRTLYDALAAVKELLFGPRVMWYFDSHPHLSLSPSIEIDRRSARVRVYLPGYQGRYSLTGALHEAGHVWVVLHTLEGLPTAPWLSDHETLSEMFALLFESLAGEIVVAQSPASRETWWNYNRFAELMRLWMVLAQCRWQCGEHSSVYDAWHEFGFGSDINLVLVPLRERILDTPFYAWDCLRAFLLRETVVRLLERNFCQKWSMYSGAWTVLREVLNEALHNRKTGGSNDPNLTLDSSGISKSTNLVLERLQRYEKSVK